MSARHVVHGREERKTHWNHRGREKSGEIIALSSRHNYLILKLSNQIKTLAIYLTIASEKQNRRHPKPDFHGTKQTFNQCSTSSCRLFRCIIRNAIPLQIVSNAAGPWVDYTGRHRPPIRHATCAPTTVESLLLMPLSTTTSFGEFSIWWLRRLWGRGFPRHHETGGSV